MDMTPFFKARPPRRRLARPSAAALKAYFRSVGRWSGADYVPARVKAWWVP